MLSKLSRSHGGLSPWSVTNRKIKKIEEKIGKERFKDAKAKNDDDEWYVVNESGEKVSAPYSSLSLAENAMKEKLKKDPLTRLSVKKFSNIKDDKDFFTEDPLTEKERRS